MADRRRPISYQPPDERHRGKKDRKNPMVRQSLIAAAVAVVAVTSLATAGLARTETGAPQRTIVHQV
jgi:hypothetical protein